LGDIINCLPFAFTHRKGLLLLQNKNKGENNVTETDLFTEFRTAYLLLENETQQELTIWELVEWAKSWWNKRNVTLLESTLQGLLGSWRDIIFYTIETCVEIEQSLN